MNCTIISQVLVVLFSMFLVLCAVVVIRTSERFLKVVASVGVLFSLYCSYELIKGLVLYYKSNYTSLEDWAYRCPTEKDVAILGMLVIASLLVMGAMYLYTKLPDLWRAVVNVIGGLGWIATIVAIIASPVGHC